ncbi:transposable element Tcb1 transposase [Trichonephila clavipes]|nr:transposable element Tcb1 transposase [Trichonephila clavipes]
MTVQRYVHDILQSHVLPLMQRLPEQFFYKTMLCLTRQGCLKTVSTLLLPVIGLPDPQIGLHVNISGIIWDGELNELEARLQQIWNEMSQDIIQNLYSSMPDCIASCIRTRGGSTGY